MKLILACYLDCGINQYHIHSVASMRLICHGMTYLHHFHPFIIMNTNAKDGDSIESSEFWVNIKLL